MQNKSGIFFSLWWYSYDTIMLILLKLILQVRQVIIQEKVEIMVPLNYISNFWKNLEMFLINCENNLDLNWSKNCILVVTDVQDQVITFSVNDTKRYVLVVT